MILKTLTHDRGSSDCWNFYDNVESASVFFDEASHMSCIAVRFKGDDAEVVIGLTDTAYLCNDKGQTIEKLRPSEEQIYSAELQTACIKIENTLEFVLGEPV